MSRSPRSRRRSGFTILEVVLAMGILAIGTTVVLSLLTFGAALSQSAVLSTSSAAAIEAVVADLEETLFPLEPDGTLGEPAPIEDRPVPGVPGVRYSATAVANPDHPTEYRVDVEVRWSTGGTRRGRRFQTILLRELSFGERLRRQFVEGRVLPSPPVSSGP